MPEIYIVRRPFKSNGVFYGVGALIEDPSLVKLFKIKVDEGKIIRVPDNEEDLQALYDLFEVKLKVDLKEVLAKRASKGPSVEPVTPTEQPTTPPVTSVTPKTTTNAPKGAAVSQTTAPKK